jgi:hypothetical protein
MAFRDFYYGFFTLYVLIIGGLVGGLVDRMLSFYIGI